MEPAGHRREQVAQAGVHGAEPAAAMEPAGHRREQRPPPRPYPPCPCAAMEPAGHRREQQAGLGTPGRCGTAAMEPAGHRREQGRPRCRAGRYWPRRNGARRSSAGAGCAPGGSTSPATRCRNGARRSSAGAGLAKSEPGDLRKVYVVRAVNKARDQNQLYGLVKVQETAADLHASAPRRWSHHLSARSSDDD